VSFVGMVGRHCSPSSGALARANPEFTNMVTLGGFRLPRSAQFRK
jgi:hypothetical protein